MLLSKILRLPLGWRLFVSLIITQNGSENKFSAVISILFTFCNGVNVVGRRLIYEIVEPVGEKEICVCAPGNVGRLFCVIAGEIVLRNFDGLALSEVTKILVFEGVGIVFAMTGDEYLSTLFICDGVDACLIGRGKNSESGRRLDILTEDGGVT